MKLRYRYANQVVGIFVVVAVVLTVALIVLMGANQRWFRRNYEYHARFDTAKDVAVGMSITFRGFTIGQVRSIQLTERNDVHVVFTIHEEYVDKVTRDSLIQVVTNPLGGGQILFHQGREHTEPLPEGSRILTHDSREGMRLIEEGRVIILRDADPIAQAISQIDPILASIDRILVSVVGLTDEIDLAVRGQSTGPIGETIAGFERTMGDLQQTVISANRMIADTAAHMSAVLGDVQLIAANLERTSAALADPTGLVKTLIDPRGSFATLLDDENRLYDEIMQVISSLDQSIGTLDASLNEIGQFTEYLNTAQPQIMSLLEEGRQTITAGQDVLQGLRNNPLIRGGIPEPREQPTTFRSVRDEDF